MKRYCGVQLIFAGLAILILFGSCGYKFAGSGSLPNKVETVYIPVFQNKTNEVGLETLITNEVIDEFVLRRKNALAQAGVAESILKGIVKSVRVNALTTSGSGVVRERRVTVVVTASLVTPEGKIIWIDQNISDSETYPVETASETDISKREAIEALTERLAENLFNRLTEDF